MRFRNENFIMKFICSLYIIPIIVVFPYLINSFLHGKFLIDKVILVVFLIIFLSIGVFYFRRIFYCNSVFVNDDSITLECTLCNITLSYNNIIKIEVRKTPMWSKRLFARELYEIKILTNSNKKYIATISGDYNYSKFASIVPKICRIY